MATIPKHGKDLTNPKFGLIATSCNCETMKQMINIRLVWHLGSYTLLTNRNAPSGFWSKM